MYIKFALVFVRFLLTDILRFLFSLVWVYSGKIIGHNLLAKYCFFLIRVIYLRLPSFFLQHLFSFILLFLILVWTIFFYYMKTMRKHIKKTRSTQKTIWKQLRAPFNLWKIRSAYLKPRASHFYLLDLIFQINT